MLLIRSRFEGLLFCLKRFFRIIPNSIPNLSQKLSVKKYWDNMFIAETKLGVIKESLSWIDRKMSSSARPLKYLLGWLIAGTRGGVTRAEIIKTIHDRPQNANQLANNLKVDYKTVRYHLEVLEKNHIITSVGDKYGATYFLTQTMEDNYAMFEEILKKIWKK